MTTGTMKTGLEIAQEALLRPISDIAAAAGVTPDELEAAGRQREYGRIVLSLLPLASSHEG